MNPRSFFQPARGFVLALIVALGPRVPGQDAATGNGLPEVDPNTGLPSQISSTSSVDPNTGQPIPSLPKELNALNPESSWTALLATAKAAEEGDADLTAASGQYLTIVRIFDHLRPIAAEALYRYALVEAKREHNEESMGAHTRLIQWFPDFTEYVKKSLATRNNTLPALPAPDADAAPATTFRMSPELMRRYGLTSPPATTEPDAPSPADTMSPELMTRYGLRSRPATPAASSSVPRDLKFAELAELHDRRSELVAASGRTAADLRKARLELQRVEGLQGEDVPPNLVSDERLRTLIVGLEDGLTGLSQDQIEKILEGRRLRIREYFEKTYQIRLRRTVEILSRELDQLRRETTEIDLAISKVQVKLLPKF